ncbi:MAG: hypothetical protein AAF349_00375 [Cyanobacteria bacterium P01_A01_bin.68]
MNESALFEADNSNYVLINKRVLYANACAYAVCVSHLANFFDESTQEITQKTMRLGQVEALRIPEHKLEEYVQALVEGKTPEMLLIYNNPFSPDELV